MSHVDNFRHVLHVGKGFLFFLFVSISFTWAWFRITCFSSLVIRELKIKTTMRYHPTLVRMAIIKISTNNKYWRGCGEKGTLLHCCWECKLVQPLWRTVWRLKTKIPTAIPLLVIYLKKNMIWKDTCTQMFIAALFTIAKMWKQLKCPLTWMDKEDVAHIYNLILLSH